jgi:bacterioferritin-associated ferredoxin
MELPLGFNNISSVYLPLLPIPDTSSLLLTTTPLYTIEDFLYSKPLNDQVVSILDSTKNWSLSLDYIFDYATVNSVTKFPIISFYCQVFDSNGVLAPPGIRLVLKILQSDTKLINLPVTINSLTNSKGIANFNLHLNFTTVVNTTLTFGVYPVDGLDESSIVINNTLLEFNPSNAVNAANLALFQSFNYKSNKVVIQTANNNTLTKKSNLTNEINLYDNSVSLSNTLITESINQIYNDFSTLTTTTNEYISPYDTCATSSVESGLRLIQGFTKNEICRYAGWGDKVLFNVHSHLSANANSEVNLADKTIKTNKTNATFLAGSSVTLDRYKDILEVTGQHVAATTSTYLSTQTTQGNKLTTAQVDQTHAQHIRLNAGANVDLHAGGKISFVANQLFTNAKWINIASDTFQQLSQHYWLRSEELLSIAGKDTIRYNHGSLQEYSANSLIASGQTINYSDVLWNQIGQVNSPPLHPSRTEPLTYRYDGENQTPYGTAINLSMQDYHIVSKFGHIRLRATQHMKFLSDMGGFYFRGISSAFITDTKNLKLKSLNGASIESKTRVNINAPMVCINCTNIPEEYIDGTVDTTNITLAQIKVAAPVADIVGKPINSAGQVLNNSGQVIAATTAPFLNTAGNVVHSVLDKAGNLVGFSNTPSLNSKTVVAPLTDQPSINQGQVAKRESISTFSYGSYIPMVFSKLSDPAPTVKTTSGSTTGPAVQVGSKLPNPGGVSISGASGSGSAN